MTGFLGYFHQFDRTQSDVHTTESCIDMSKKKLENLCATKIKLAEKYDRLSKLANSDPKRNKFRRQAAYFRYQAKMLEIKATQ